MNHLHESSDILVLRGGPLFLLPTPFLVIHLFARSHHQLYELNVTRIPLEGEGNLCET